MRDLYLAVDTNCGLGHKTRSNAIAEGWLARGGTAHWQWDKDPTDSVVLLDGYYFTDTDRRWYMGRGNIVVCLDDIGGYFTADIVVNYNCGAEKVEYSGQVSKFLLGPKYFTATTTLLNASPGDSLIPFDCESANRKMEYAEFLSRMAKSQYVLCSASVKCYEALYLNKSVLLRCTIDNQRPAYHALIEGGWARPETKENIALFDRDEKARRRYGRGRKLVDGKGTSRIIKEILLQSYSKKN